ncbi:unnamed protein product [Vitrella brassicaformis CCMP3155]|uniref:Snurportin-1 n=1 Tax=Vitrella brassicaformis (strain CCMP3155) TaxID=1169540 RepID=A0A0G4GR84_VITBC|nr:unnamed protein product [Vitrella brassicaformis CCMP3155]|eukprot:CEM33043.1 unnamed protein product [Vitrella brassicaformis CCMP3155]
MSQHSSSPAAEGPSSPSSCLYQHQHSRRHKPRGNFLSDDQTRRTNAALARQERDRADLLAQIRRIASESITDEAPEQHAYADEQTECDDEEHVDVVYEEGRGGEVGMEEDDEQENGDESHADMAVVEGEGGEKKHQGPSRRARMAARLQVFRFFAGQLVHPDWLVSPPPDLAHNWLVAARPEGNRMLVISKHGWAVARNKNGRFQMKFPCLLPPRGVTIVDVAFAEATRTMHLLDVLCWNDCLLMDSSTECRHFFLKSRYEEMESELRETSVHHMYPMVLVDLHECTQQHLLRLYYEDLDYPKDSLLFVHKEAHYDPGLNPLWLQWRDAHLSRFAIDTTDPTGKDHPHREVGTLQLTKRHNKLKTMDGRIVGAIDDTTRKQHRLKPGQLVKCEMDGIDMDTMEVQNLMPLGRGPKTRLYPDSFSRLVVQAFMRMDSPPMDFNRILDAIAQSHDHEDGAGGGHADMDV